MKLRLDHRIGSRPADELLLDELDGHLAGTELQRLQQHLAGCSDCREARTFYRRLHQRIAGTVHDRQELETARIESRRRVAAAQTTARRPKAWRALVGTTAGLAGVLVVLMVVLIGSRVASPSYLERELVVQRDLAVPGGSASLLVEQGSRFAKPGYASGVHALVDIAFEHSPTGSVEIRIQTSGPGYGIIARVPDASASRRVTLDGALPDVERGQSQRVDIWLHFDEGDIDTARVTIDLTAAVGGGTRAAAR